MLALDQFKHVKWETYKSASRDLAVAVFGRVILATHSLTGLVSNANAGKTKKPPLDATKVLDIIGN